MRDTMPRRAMRSIFDLTIHSSPPLTVKNTKRGGLVFLYPARLGLRPEGEARKRAQPLRGMISSQYPSGSSIKYIPISLFS
jgi:hypothetical protein